LKKQLLTSKNWKKLKMNISGFFFFVGFKNCFIFQVMLYKRLGIIFFTKLKNIKSQLLYALSSGKKHLKIAFLRQFEYIKPHKNKILLEKFQS